MKLDVIVTAGAVAWAALAIMRQPRWSWVQTADVQARQAALSGKIKVPPRASASQLAVLADAGFGLPAQVNIG